ncbi:MAG: glutathione S-transferase family protein [Polyangiaceae bacterium]
MSITLYEAPMSSAVPVVHALLELGVKFERVTFDLAAKDQKKPDFLKINPNGKVPALVSDGTPMFEALAIVQWLGDRYGVDKKLWPAADSPERMTAMAWSTWAYVTFGPAIYRLRLATNPELPKEMRSEAHANDARRDLSAMLTVLEGHLASRDYILGKEHTLADIIVGDTVTWGTYVGAPVSDFPRVRAWLERVHARDSYKKAWAMPSAPPAA